MLRVAAACVIACIPFVPVKSDDPKPDVQKLKDEVELLDAKLGIWKAKVAGAERIIDLTKAANALLEEAQRAGAASRSESYSVRRDHAQAQTDLEVSRAELKLAEVTLNQAKRRLTTAEKGAGVPAEKSYAIRFENKSWGEVFDWFVKESGLVNAVKVKPTGTFTLKPPPGKKYTLTELVDLFNEALAPDFVLVRGEKSFTVIPADEKPDEALFPRVDVKDLGGYGKSEIVSVLLSTGSHDPDNMLPRLKRMLSPFGSVRSLGKSAVVVCDKADNVKLVAESVEVARAK
jgi:hypothetical protein